MNILTRSTYTINSCIFSIRTIKSDRNRFFINLSFIDRRYLNTSRITRCSCSDRLIIMRLVSNGLPDSSLLRGSTTT
ncbi:hypothetical protein PVT01_120005300 [Plasmodium vivax]|uniref:Uncharacterized protein n=1 Tax=Plasmodium vivax TaxID=5855 RepID=A0A1G4H0Q9_PLAVI|nr:hypothetical protein PVT01_120005300 [Plasmodium vivax]